MIMLHNNVPQTQWFTTIYLLLPSLWVTWARPVVHQGLGANLSHLVWKDAFSFSVSALHLLLARVCLRVRYPLLDPAVSFSPFVLLASSPLFSLYHFFSSHKVIH